MIGRDNALPWHQPADLQHFKTLTLGKPVLMGRHTHESIGAPLPGRRNIVLSRSAHEPAAGVERVHSFAAALALVDAAPELMVIGGGQVYRAALGAARRVYLTRVHVTIDGDAYFPALDPDQWRVLESERRPADARNAHDMTFLTLERVAAPVAA